MGQAAQLLQSCGGLKAYEEFKAAEDERRAAERRRREQFDPYVICGDIQILGRTYVVRHGSRYTHVDVWRREAFALLRRWRGYISSRYACHVCPPEWGSDGNSLSPEATIKRLRMHIALWWEALEQGGHAYKTGLWEYVYDRRLTYWPLSRRLEYYKGEKRRRLISAYMRTEIGKLEEAGEKIGVADRVAMYLGLDSRISLPKYEAE